MLQILSEALGLIVRPLVTIMLVGTLCVIAWNSNITLSNTELVTIVTMALGFYFGERSGEAITKAAATTASARRRASDVNPQVSISDSGPVTVNSDSSDSSRAQS